MVQWLEWKHLVKGFAGSNPGESTICFLTCMGGGDAGSRNKTFCCGGGGGGRAQPGLRIIVTYRKLITPIPHRRLHLYQPLAGSQEADTIYLALNRSCPWSHINLWSETLILIMGITIDREQKIVKYICIWFKSIILIASSRKITFSYWHHGEWDFLPKMGLSHHYTLPTEQTV